MVAAPLDTCGILFLFGADYQNLVNAQKTNKLVANILLNYKYSTGKDVHSSSTELCDVEASWLLFSTEYLQCSTLPLVVNESGYTVVDTASGTPTIMALDWTETGMKEFESEISRRLLTWKSPLSL